MSWRMKRKKRSFFIPASILSLIILSFFGFLFSMDNGDSYKKNNEDIEKVNSNNVSTDKENVYEKIKQKDIII
ncbi:hypothetical protein [Paenibacillus herberti]|uniref:Uncharacterized protein n=1 Tax=Paenibacillus herberti TaxID=1619309 RepID=A0A229NWS9_9BACL|nr:hypothetical protein [Paenibacillus herberti]OXM14350.1 hypothetical protein CGZ75_15490 [Paenibacillus herberti]